MDQDRLAMVIADVSGKGIPAAMFMMIAKSMIQTQAVSGRGPKEILETVNHLICENNREEMFVTVWFAILDLNTGTLTAANAGHEFPILKKPEGRFEILCASNTRARRKTYETGMVRTESVHVYPGEPEHHGCVRHTDRAVVRRSPVGSGRAAAEALSLFLRQGESGGQ